MELLTENSQYICFYGSMVEFKKLLWDRYFNIKNYNNAYTKPEKNAAKYVLCAYVVRCIMHLNYQLYNQLLYVTLSCSVWTLLARLTLEMPREFAGYYPSF